MYEVNLAATQLFQVVVYVAQNEVVCILKINENVKITLVVLFATRYRAKDSNSLDSQSFSILLFVMLNLFYVICSRFHC